MLSSARRHRSRAWIPLLLAVLAWSGGAPAWAAVGDGLPSPAELAARIASTQGDDTLPVAERDGIVADYRAALESLRALARYPERARELQREATLVPAQLRDIERRLQRGADTLVLDDGATYETLDRLLAEAQSALNTARTRATDAQREVEELEAAPVELQDALSVARSEREALGGQLAELNLVREKLPGQLARQLTLRAEIAAKDAQMKALNVELETAPPRLDLALAKRRLAAAEVDWGNARAARLQDLLGGRRGDVVDRVRAEAVRLAAQADSQPEVVARETRANAVLAERLAALIAQLGEVANQQRVLHERVEELRELRNTAADQLEIAQLGGALGRALHQQRQQLPSLIPDPQGLQARGEALALARFEQLELRAEIKARERADQRQGERLPAADREMQEALLREQRTLGADFLGRLDRTYTAYIADMTALDQLQRELSALAGDYAALLNRDLVWIADAPRPSWRWPLGVLEPMAAIVDGELWRQLLGALHRGWQRKPLALTLGSMAVVAAFYYRRRLRAWLVRFADAVGDAQRDRFAPTLGALLVSLGIALPVPLALMFAGQWLRIGGDETAFVAALARGLRDAAVVALALELIRALCRERGLLDAHLGLRPTLRRKLVQALYWLLPMLVGCAILIGGTNASAMHMDTLGRAAFVVGSGALAWFIGNGLHPERGLLSAYFGPARRHGWPWNLRRLWFGGLALLPLVFALLALSGYYFTAQQLLSRFCASGLLVAGVVLARQIALRGLALFEQRLEREQAQIRRAAEQRREAEAEAEAGESTVEMADTHEVDIASIQAQVRAFLRIAWLLALGGGLWWIWVDLLPALEALRGIVLWEYASGTAEHPVTAAVTAAGVGLALLVSVISYLAARNLPGLLEVAVLQRLEVDAGARYAANAISRYLIIATGALIVVNMLGLEWSKLQWLVAALGVGLGFGLQEIVGNFVSGLIILFERPFRIGDTVTIGSVSGTVTRIQIRATTITDWDRKELIVPNKTFITDQLVNWTLNDPVLRVVVPVGIAYGSDTALARQVLMEIAEANPRVAKDPAPQVWFMGFGESSLNFEARVFVMGLPEILPATHELHQAIDLEFRRHGLEIAFPQRDLHLRSLDSRVAELLRGQSLPAGGPPQATA